MTVIIFIIVLALLILVHEVGHFLAAKKAGVKVPEFGLGFPPKIFGTKIGETEYTLNWIPFGGFVKIIGENAEEDISEKDYPQSFMAQSRPVQAAIISAGVIFNLLFAWVLISIGFMIGMPTSAETLPEESFITPPVLMITSVIPNTPAYNAGLKAGDEIFALVSGSDELSDIKNINTTQEFISSHGKQEVGFFYKRGNKQPSLLKIIPEEGIVDGKPAVGITMDIVGIAKLNPVSAISEGAKMTIQLTGAIAAGLWGFFVSLISGGADLSNIAGPVGIAGLVGQASTLGFVYLLSFTALISINLAIINFIPFPALDGGRLLFILIEAIKRSPIPPKITMVANTVGFLLLIGLMLLVTYNDIARIISG